MGKYQFCVPAKAGAATGAFVGLVVWALVAFVPAFHDGVPEPVVAVLPFVLGYAGHVLASWVTAHPGTAPLSPPAAPVTAVPAAAPSGAAGAAPSASLPGPAAGTAGRPPSGVPS